MNCKKCKNSIGDESEFCPKCGRWATKDHLHSDEALVAKIVRQFSFGAFSFGWIYFAAAGAVVQSLAVFLVSIIFLAAQIYGLTRNQPLAIAGTFLNISFLLYLGSVGKRISANSHPWKDAKHFQKNQLLWDLFGIISFCLSIALAMLLIVYGGNIQKITEGL